MFFRFLAVTVIFLAMHESAIAEVKSFGQITLDIPPTWRTEQDNKGLYIIAQDGSSVVSILSNTLPEGLILADEARKLAKKFNGTEPQAQVDGKSFYFLYSDSSSGYRSIYMVTAIGNNFISIAQVGENDEADGIIHSMKYNQGG